MFEKENKKKNIKNQNQLDIIKDIQGEPNSRNNMDDSSMTVGKYGVGQDQYGEAERDDVSGLTSGHGTSHYTANLEMGNRQRNVRNNRGNVIPNDTMSTPSNIGKPSVATPSHGRRDSKMRLINNIDISIEDPDRDRREEATHQ